MGRRHVGRGEGWYRRNGWEKGKRGNGEGKVMGERAPDGPGVPREMPGLA